MIEESKRFHANCSDSDSNCNGSSLPCRNSRLIVPRFGDSQQPSAAVTMASPPAQKHSAGTARPLRVPYPRHQNPAAPERRPPGGMR
jgi:hypothetical protein